MKAALILANANVIALNRKFSNAQLIAIKNGKILAVSKNDDLKELRHKDTKVVDCNGKAVLPGFIDAHCHIPSFVESFLTLNLDPRNKIRSISDIQVKIQQLSQGLPPGTWIRGKGYNEFYLIDKRHPTRWDLDVVTSKHPVKLTHRTGHAHVLNSLALGLVGI